jgi:hypothetical protein
MCGRHYCLTSPASVIFPLSEANPRDMLAEHDEGVAELVAPQ